MAFTRTPSFDGLITPVNGSKTGLEDKQRDKVTTQNPPVSTPSPRAHA